MGFIDTSLGADDRNAAQDALRRNTENHSEYEYEPLGGKVWHTTSAGRRNRIAENDPMFAKVVLDHWLCVIANAPPPQIVGIGKTAYRMFCGARAANGVVEWRMRNPPHSAVRDEVERIIIAKLTGE